VTVRLSSETGRRSTKAACLETYHFEGLAPGAYEVFASTEDGTLAGFIELFLDQDSETGTVHLTTLPQVSFEVRHPGSADTGRIPATVIGRRQDLAEAETEREIPTPQATLAPGHWEMNAHVGPGQYVESIVGMFAGPRRSWRTERPSDWYDVFLGMSSMARVRITVSDQAGQIAGTVTSEGKSVPGVPVFLWPTTEAARRAVGSKQVLSDTEGKFHFDGLSPSDYRLLATFDLTEVDEDTLNEARAVTIRVEASQAAAVELPLWVAP